MSHGAEVDPFDSLGTIVRAGWWIALLVYLAWLALAPFEWKKADRADRWVDESIQPRLSFRVLALVLVLVAWWWFGRR